MIKNEITDAILRRRTVREYTPEKLTLQQIETIIECAMYAPSARNLQPCFLRAVSGKETLDRINADFKNLIGWDTPAYTKWDVNPFYHNAPTVFFIFGKTKSDMDAGIMAENIAIAAYGLGLSTCIIGSIGALLNDEKGKPWKKFMKIPEDYEFLISVACGHGNEKPEVKKRNKEQFMIIE